MIIEPKSNTEPAAPRPASPSPSASTESSASVSSASSDEPPPYSPVDPTSPLSSSSTLPLPRIRPANFLSVTRSGDAPLCSAYVLDPYLQIPTALLRAAESGNGSPRPNLKLETKEGSLDAELWVIPHATAVMRGNAPPTPSAASTSTPLGTPVVKIELKSYSGPVSLRVVCVVYSLRFLKMMTDLGVTAHSRSYARSTADHRSQQRRVHLRELASVIPGFVLFGWITLALTPNGRGIYGL
jgi:hypothetical protein